MKASDISAFIQKKIANFNRTIFIDCLAIILLSYAIRCLTIGWHGFSDVEAQAIGIAKLSNINEITTACQQDGNPPLFHFLLYLWAHLFGWSDFSLSQWPWYFLGSSHLWYI